MSVRETVLSSSMSEERAVGSVIRLVKVLLFVESAMYSAVTPLLPHYARALHASKPSLGVLAAAYAAGLLPGSLLGGSLAVRVGVRRTTLAGVLSFAVAVIAFGLASSMPALVGFRTVQGVACGCVWGGALTWVIAVAPSARRGAALGAALSAAVLGTLAGPLLGTAAVLIGAPTVFGLVGAGSFLLAAAVARSSEPPHRQQAAKGSLRALLQRRAALLGIWLTMLDAMTRGAIAVLIPLRLAQFGASAIVVGATFSAAAALSALAARLVGHICDRRGVFLPVTVGLCAGALVLAILPLPRSVFALAALTVVLVGGPLSAFLTPSVSLLAASAEAAGVALAVGTMLFNVAFALGEMIGAPAAATVAQATSDTIPFIALALLLVLTVPAALRQRRDASPAIAPVLERADLG